jgi:N-acetylneuraminic acid mutarotase
MPTARMIARTCSVQGRIYVMGGCLQGWIDVTTVEEYDPQTDTWTPRADMPSLRRCFSTSVVDGKIYAIGGVHYGDKRYLTTVEEYDPMTDTWTPKADMPTARWNLSTSVVNGRIYAIGGASKVERDPQRVLSIVEEYDPGVETGIQALFWGALKTTFR